MTHHQQAQNTPMQRRSFLKASAAIGTGWLVLPSGFVNGQDAPSNKLNVALLGTWGRGEAHFGALKDENVVALARERGTVFEVCITSNYQSGVVTNLESHPFPHMLEAGLNATLNTDDPSVSDITLGEELRVACETLGVPLSVLRGQILAAARAAFLPPDEKEDLTALLHRELDQHIPQV